MGEAREQARREVSRSDKFSREVKALQALAQVQTR